MLNHILIPMTVGLAIFLFGMKAMEWALHSWAGRYLETALERFTRTPARGMLTSTGITAVLQSSTAVTVITIGLVNAGVMRFPQTLGIILGSNIGTCITTELVGLNLNKLALPLMLISAAVWFIAMGIPDSRSGPEKLRPFRLLPIAFFGFACILLGMQVMQSILPELQSRGFLAWFVQHAQRSLLWGIVAGAVLTAILHSGAVTIAMAMGLASISAISPQLGIAIVIGANVGTCVTALIASIGGTRFGVYVAWSHILLNVGGALLFYPFIDLLEGFTRHFAENAGGQVAHAQTVFNIVCSILALPVCYLPALHRIQLKEAPPPAA
ncbi:Na/Pi cotransporter family protein [Gorillibacterium sp. sgz5001074]|uniref:Na/Pi cotransporter family protein n=1 Tax=Gorillibacterium sp. sgz5001074 TaxID=3446695 RepID=UPI003F6766FD